MTIVCGTDFSEFSSRAVTAAAHLAKRTKLPLHLVHTIEVADDGVEETRRALRASAMARLEHATAGFVGLVGASELHVEFGLPDEALLDVAGRVSAKLIVVGAAGRRDGKVALGAHADRIAQRAQVPVIVVRDVAPFEQWALEARPLGIVLGFDPSSSSEAALRWVDELRRFGPCDVTALQLYWPPEQFQRLGLEGVRSYVDADPEVTRTLEREFAERLTKLHASSAMRFRSEPHLGRIADRLADLAAESKADLVVVGSHSRNALERLWEGSVSRGVLRCAHASVACVPAPPSSVPHTTPKLRRVLVTTDFSPIGDAAIPYAYAAAAPGGIVHLLHVVEAHTDALTPHDVFVPTGPTSTADAARQRLAERIPGDARAEGTMLHVLEAREPARAICQAAERLGVDLVCLGTRGRSGAAKALLGSVAQEVLAKCNRPVLLARLPTD